MIRCLVFDLDDTLYAERDYVRSGFKAAVQALPATLRSSVETECWSRFIGGSRVDIFDSVLRQHGLHDPALVMQMVTAYREHKPSIALDPAATPILLQARIAGCFIGIITDGRSAGQHAKIEALGLAALVDAVICTDDLGREFWKPHPRAYTMMAHAATAEPRECAYVGDNPAKDFLAPNELGWLTVMLRRDEAVHDQGRVPAGGTPGVTIDALPQVLTALGIPLTHSSGGTMAVKDSRR